MRSELNLRGLDRANVAQSGNGQDRRRRVRVPMKCEVRLLRGREAWILAETLDVSAGGFYCLSGKPLPIGEILSCHLNLSAAVQCRNVMLHCTVEILRVDTRSPGFGIACRINDYTVAD